MFEGMDIGFATTDQLEQQLIANETLRSRLAAVDMTVLEELDRRQVATADGSRSLSEWVSSRVDVSIETARNRVSTMRRTTGRSDLRDGLAAGEMTFDRTAELSKLPAEIGHLTHLDIGGVRGDVAKRVRVTAEDEARSVDDAFLVIQPSLDESWWRLWGGLDGYSGAIVDKALSEAADQLPDLPEDKRMSAGWRKAQALREICTSDEAPPAQVTVIVDAKEAIASDAESGVVLEAGPRGGAQALQAVLCDATTEVLARTEQGRYLDYGRKVRTVPPVLKRALVDKYHGRCAADGCNSRYRLEAHHKTPWSEGGATDQDDLVLLCWFHHHVVLHQWGYQLFAHPDHGRIRFRPPPRTS